MLNWSLICLHDVTWESVAALTDHFANAFNLFAKTLRVYMTWQRNDDSKFDTDSILLREIQCKERDILIFSVVLVFQCGFRLKSCKICKNNNHTCLFHCINTCRVPGNMSELEAVKLNLKR